MYDAVKNNPSPSRQPRVARATEEIELTEETAPATVTMDSDEDEAAPEDEEGAVTVTNSAWV